MIEAIEQSFHFLETSGARHTEDEEQSIFPRLRDRVSTSEGRIIDSLNADHAQAERMLDELLNLFREAQQNRAFTRDLVARYTERAKKLQSFYLAHIRKEDENLMEIIRYSFTNEELAEIAQEMRDRRS